MLAWLKPVKTSKTVVKDILTEIVDKVCDVPDEDITCIPVDHQSDSESSTQSSHSRCMNSKTLVNPGPGLPSEGNGSSSNKPGLPSEGTGSNSDKAGQKRPCPGAHGTSTGNAQDYEKNKRKRTFQDSWLIEFPWLKYDNNVMYCAVCRRHGNKADKSSPLVKGIGETSFKNHD